MADLRGGARDARPPGPKFLHFHAVFGKNWPNNRLTPPPFGLAPPPLGNPGSATAKWLESRLLNVISDPGDSLREVVINDKLY